MPEGSGRGGLWCHLAVGVGAPGLGGALWRCGRRTRLMHELGAGSTDCVVLSLRVCDASVSCVILCGPVQLCRRRMSCAVTLGTLGGPERAALCSRLVSPWDGLCARQAVRIAGTCLMVVPGKVGLRHACFFLLASQAWPALEKGPPKRPFLASFFPVAKSEGAL